ncbi:MAG TPA: SMC-Scp complex subunit ScpB [Terracidiphilus sp.]|jgi:segregation and condensation protein B|nr:SMC-Scp complex subunit ScpB [Terracidiphilus sp.]
MSLKAKLEAVIYAAEEPVTLAQLAAIFAADAFEWEAEQAATRAAQSQPGQSEAGQFEPVEFDSAQFDPAQSDPEPSVAGSAEPDPAYAEAHADRDPAAPLPLLNEHAAAEEPATAEEPAKASAPESEPKSGQESGSKSGPEAGPAEAAESDLKREARQRDREVRAILRQVLDELVADCVADGRGIEIREIAGGYRMATKPECHDAVRMFVKSLKPPLKLSLPALETLAVVAYKQPITAPEVNEIRGVDSSGVFGSLLARKLIATAGRKQVIGRPILYKTTREFLLRFGLKDVSELPSMEEFEKMAAIELEEPETAEAGDVTEIGEPEPMAPEETAEAIADDLQEELAEATADGAPRSEAEQTAGTDGEAGQAPGPARDHTSNHLTNQGTNHAAGNEPAGDSAGESSGQPSSVSHSEE